ncbi:uncharacterized protein LOC112488278 [Cynoglossus semilaevis]|uniref:uncharacterized protein LOC112488278 n=1 Tax=Cynoglossus semilaevis TaxID=244447 RepID=UPI000D628A94|nr:uncharacterized protein LOC112488278 [Cynoglossus semilaevis]
MPASNERQIAESKTVYAEEHKITEPLEKDLTSKAVYLKQAKAEEETTKTDVSVPPLPEETFKQSQQISEKVLETKEMVVVPTDKNTISKKPKSSNERQKQTKLVKVAVSESVEEVKQSEKAVKKAPSVKTDTIIETDVPQQIVIIESDDKDVGPTKQKDVPIKEISNVLSLDKKEMQDNWKKVDSVGPEETLKIKSTTREEKAAMTEDKIIQKDQTKSKQIEDNAQKLEKRQEERAFPIEKLSKIEKVKHDFGTVTTLTEPKLELIKSTIPEPPLTNVIRKSEVVSAKDEPEQPEPGKVRAEDKRSADTKTTSRQKHSGDLTSTKTETDVLKKNDALKETTTEEPMFEEAEILTKDTKAKKLKPSKKSEVRPLSFESETSVVQLQDDRVSLGEDIQTDEDQDKEKFSRVSATEVKAETSMQVLEGQAKSETDEVMSIKRDFYEIYDKPGVASGLIKEEIRIKQLEPKDQYQDLIEPNQVSLKGEDSVLYQLKAPEVTLENYNTQDLHFKSEESNQKQDERKAKGCLVTEAIKTEETSQPQTAKEISETTAKNVKTRMSKSHPEEAIFKPQLSGTPFDRTKTEVETRGIQSAKPTVKKTADDLKVSLEEFQSEIVLVKDDYKSPVTLVTDTRQKEAESSFSLASDVDVAPVRSQLLKDRDAALEDLKVRDVETKDIPLEKLKEVQDANITPQSTLTAVVDDTATPSETYSKSEHVEKFGSVAPVMEVPFEQHLLVENKDLKSRACVREALPILEASGDNIAISTQKLENVGKTPESVADTLSREKKRPSVTPNTEPEMILDRSASRTSTFQLPDSLVSDKPVECEVKEILLQESVQILDVVDKRPSDSVKKGHSKTDQISDKTLEKSRPKPQNIKIHEKQVQKQPLSLATELDSLGEGSVSEQLPTSEKQTEAVTGKHLTAQEEMKDEISKKYKVSTKAKPVEPSVTEMPKANIIQTKTTHHKSHAPEVWEENYEFPPQNVQRLTREDEEPPGLHSVPETRQLSLKAEQSSGGTQRRYICVTEHDFFLLLLSCFVFLALATTLGNHTFCFHCFLQEVLRYLTVFFFPRALPCHSTHHV